MKKLFGDEFHKQGRQDKIFDVINYSGMILILLIILYPLYFIVIASFSNPNAVAGGDVWFWPVGFNLEGYKEIFSYREIWIGYANSIYYTLVGTAVNLVLIIPAAFALSRKELIGKKPILGLFALTMFFGGGLIPTYLLVDALNLKNTMWALTLPGAVGVYNLIVARSFFQQSIPEELFESAALDGCGYFAYFFKIAIPISKPIIAVMFLIHAVGHWNSYFSALIYIVDRDLYPLQVVLREILIQNQSMQQGILDTAAVEKQRQMAELIKYGTIIVSSLPVLILYPFIQKYFVKGILLGSVKG